MTLSEYSQLKRETEILFSNCDRHNDLLRTCKDAFRDVINSPRRYEQIRNIGKLLDILELRNELSENNVKHLKHIVMRLHNNEYLLKKIKQYEMSPHSKENLCYGTLKGTSQDETDIDMNNSFMTFINSNLNKMSKRKWNRILGTIIEGIGVFWRDLARNLNIGEGAIDDIEAQYATLSSKATAVLKIYDTKADPQRWFLILCDALEKSRRKDLSKELQNIMTMNL